MEKFLFFPFPQEGQRSSGCTSVSGMRRCQPGMLPGMSLGGPEAPAPAIPRVLQLAGSILRDTSMNKAPLEHIPTSPWPPAGVWALSGGHRGSCVSLSPRAALPPCQSKGCSQLIQTHPHNSLSDPSPPAGQWVWPFMHISNGRSFCFVTFEDRWTFLYHPKSDQPQIHIRSATGNQWLMKCPRLFFYRVLY